MSFSINDILFPRSLIWNINPIHLPGIINLTWIQFLALNTHKIVFNIEEEKEEH